jgi:DNA-binding NarL/FixJ family response regulator
MLARGWEQRTRCSRHGRRGIRWARGRELPATGEKARKRTPDTRGQLTAQETQIAELPREGNSNPEVGAQLFISPRTVEYHLYKVFTTLGISSRNELQRVFPSEAREAQPV